MTEDHTRDQWQQDEQALASIGAQLFRQPTEIEVRVPRALADEAVAAWQREDAESFDSANESSDQRVTRHRAGALGLIGLTLEQRGRLDGDQVVVRLDAWFVGDALNAADDAGLITG